MDIGLVLSGGGARCFAHVGVQRAFEERGVTPVAIAGVSTGALFGALWAAGCSSKTVHEMLRNTKVWEMIDPDGQGGLLSQDPIGELLSEYLPTSFEALRIPLAVNATDVQTGRGVVFNRGPLLPGILASNAFPGLFSPVHHEGFTLVDGGTLSNVPVDVIFPMTNAPVVAVDVSPSIKERVEEPDEDAGGWLQRMTATLNEATNVPVTMLRKAYIVSQSKLIEMHLAMHSPELLIRPDFPDDFGLFDFDRLEEAVALGYETTCKALDTHRDRLL